MLRISQGTFNVGTASSNSMTGTTGAVFTIEGGTTNFTGRLFVAGTAAATYTQSGGTVNVATAGNSFNSIPSFGFTSSGAVFNMSGGIINLVQASTAIGTQIDYWVRGTANITGGTLNVGTAATTAGSIFRIRGLMPNVVVDSTIKTGSCALKYGRYF